MKTVAPGKLILSGEHAVVYGRPAIAMAVNRNAQAFITEEGVAGTVSFDLPNLKTEPSSFTLRALREFHGRVSRNYEEFLAGKLSIREVLHKPVDLFRFAFVTVLDGLHLKMGGGVNVRMTSNIPIGCGMGSSAAMILSVLRGVGHFYRVEFRPEWFARYSLEVENLQHGKSSGLDTYVSMHGGCVWFQRGEAQQMPLPQMPLYIVNTGQPASSTGDTVSAVARRVGPRSGLWDEFEAVTGRMRLAMEQDDLQDFQRSVRDNHRLLNEIGVVPGRVADFVAEVENTGAAAKICGAGAAGGDAAGMVMVATREAPAELCAKYGYELMTVRPDPLGVRVV
ncbi:MAG: mevalonate kinase [Lentisphaerae bacterium]|jgi:mevalonate kinase|nr:mevalonate kinase [Lentisphaerota bacterium]